MAKTKVNSFQNVYLDDVYAFVDGDGPFLKFELYLQIGEDFYNLKTLEKLDAEVVQMALLDGIGKRGYVYKNHSSLGIMSSIYFNFFDRIEFNPYWMPPLESEARPVIKYDRLADRTPIVEVGALLKYEKEYNEKLEKEYLKKRENKTEYSSKKTRQDVNSFYYRVAHPKQKGEE